MKLKQLIENLKKINEEHGDMNIFIVDHDDFLKSMDIWIDTDNKRVGLKIID